MANGTHDYKLGKHDQAISDIQSDIKIIKNEVKNLNVWRWKLVGGVTGMAAAGSALGNYFINLI